jgi:copper chaperone CopZ
MTRNISLFAWYVLCALIVANSIARAADPSAEPKDKAACTGTCSTCPGKAKAMLSLAENKIVVLELATLVKADQEERVETAITKLKGVESCVAMSADHAVWVAYDSALCGVQQISATLEVLKFTPGRNYTLDALPQLAGKQQRCVVYVIVPPGAKHDTSIAATAGALKGVAAFRLDRMFNMFIANYDPTKLQPEQIAAALVKAGYPAGLPGGELTQP